MDFFRMIGASYFSRFLRMAIAYKAKLLCSGIFVSDRTESSLLQEDLSVGVLILLRLLKSTVDYDQKTVTVSFFGRFARTALYRSGLGSTLVIGTTVEELRSQAKDYLVQYQQNNQKNNQQSKQQTQRLATQTPTRSINTVALTQIVESAFVENDPTRLKRTRAVLILHKGEIVLEHYTPGFSAGMPLLGWSMAKSVVNALIGILVQQEKLSLDSKDLLPEWRNPNDPRREITIDHLLRMSSGLM